MFGGWAALGNSISSLRFLIELYLQLDQSSWVYCAMQLAGIKIETSVAKLGELAETFVVVADVSAETDTVSALVRSGNYHSRSFALSLLLLALCFILSAILDDTFSQMTA